MEPMPMDEPGVEPLPDFPGKPAPPNPNDRDMEPRHGHPPVTAMTSLDDTEVVIPMTSKPRPTASVRKITVNLIAVGDEALEYLMDLRRMNMTDTVNRELQRGAYIERELAKGSKLLIERPDGKQRELGFL